VLLAAGDIARCTSTGDEATAAILDATPGQVLTLGDNVYESGTPDEFANCYDPSWGRAKSRTHPALGNHEYGTAGAAGYFNYFGSAAGTPGQGWYSFDVGAWHIVALNSEDCQDADGCGAPDNQQVQWLQADLAAHPVACTLLYWHEPRFSSGGDYAQVAPLWNAAAAAGADVILVGHAHLYERMARLAPDGTVDPVNGMREFVVGTGGASHHTVSSIRAGDEVLNTDTYGVLKLTLHATGYDWSFLPEAGKTFTDSGSEACR
jgi:hypothetical protein